MRFSFWIRERPVTASNQIFYHFQQHWKKLIETLKTFNPRFYEWKTFINEKLSFTVSRMTSGLNSVFDWFQLVFHIILFMDVLNSGVTFTEAAPRRPQNDSKYIIPINFILLINDSINSEGKRIIREFFEVRCILLKINQNTRKRWKYYCV